MAFVAKHVFSLVTNQWGEAYVRGTAVSGCPAGGSVTALFSWTDNPENSASCSSRPSPAEGWVSRPRSSGLGTWQQGFVGRGGAGGSLRQLSSQPVARETPAFVCPCLSSRSVALAWRDWEGCVPNPASPGGGGGDARLLGRLRSAAAGAGLGRAPSWLCWEHHPSPGLQAPRAGARLAPTASLGSV